MTDSNAGWNHLIPLTQGPEYTLVKKQFRKGWMHPQKPKPAVLAVFKVELSHKSRKPYLDYCASVQASLPSKSNSLRQTEQFFFHGTNRACQLGENSLNLCASTDCGVCSIIQSSFDIGKSGIKNKFQRFGRGIYTSACSSKADDYSMNLHRNSEPRVLILSRVVVGKAKKMQKNATHLTDVSPLYHSVIGEPGDSLNYHECCVYSNDAIRPAYLIVYGTNSQSLISKLLNTSLA